MKIPFLIFPFLSFVLISCSNAPVFEIPSDVIVESEDYCKIEGAYSVKRLKLRNFDGINIEKFHEYLNCMGLSNDPISILKPTKISELNPRELIDLNYFLKTNIECAPNLITSFENRDLIVSGCRIKFKNSINDIVYTYNSVFFIDEEKTTIYEITTL